MVYPRLFIASALAPAGLAVVLFATGCSRKPAQAIANVPEVLVTTVKAEDVPAIAERIATLDGLVNATIGARVSGHIISQNYKEGSVVKKGDLLFQIDPRPFDEALAQAKATWTKAKASWAKADADEKRALDLFAKKVISTQERDTNTATAESSRASVQADEAAVEQAELNLGYTKITAPIDGYVTKDAVAIGDYLQVGQALMALVPPRVWVIANFKETQLRSMRPGQPATISVDAYTGLKLQGRVDSIQAGSGAAFSLLPPENATGNYVKVVQRVPVKIVLDEQQQMQRVLGPGMSVVPSVTVSDGAGVVFKVAGVAIILALGVVVAAALWIRRLREGSS